MGFQDNLPGIHIRAHNQLAIDCVYYPLADDFSITDRPVSCKIEIEYDVILQPSEYDAQVVETGTTITALYSDVVEPKTGSEFKTTDTVFTVKRITDNDKVFVTMVVTDAIRY